MSSEHHDLIAALEAALAGDDSNLVLRAHLARLFSDAGRHAEALNHASRVLIVEPTDPTSLAVMTAATAALQGNPPAAADPDTPTAVAAADHMPDTADELLDRWAGNDPLIEVGVEGPATPGVRLEDIGGMEQVKQRLHASFLEPLRNPEIAARFGKTLRGGLLLWGPPGCARLHMMLSIALVEGGEHDEAVAAARRAVLLKPENYVAHRTLGWSTYKAGRADEAKTILTRSLTLNPEDVMSHVMLADVLLRTVPRGLPRGTLKRSRLVEEVDHHGAEAIRLDPQRADGYAIRAKAAVLGNDGLQASMWANEAVKREPDNPVAHQVLGMSAQIRGDTRAAADHYVTAGNLSPRTSRSTDLLKGLRKKAPFGMLLAFVLIRLISLPLGNSSDIVQGIGVGLVLASLVFIYVVWPRWNARRSMSPTARQVLARDRELRRR